MNKISCNYKSGCWLDRINNSAQVATGLCEKIIKIFTSTLVNQSALFARISALLDIFRQTYSLNEQCRKVTLYSAKCSIATADCVRMGLPVVLSLAHPYSK